LAGYRALALGLNGSIRKYLLVIIVA
jgi:hypothetical protein